MNKKRILFIADKTGITLFDSFFRKVAESNDIVVLERPSKYLTDLKSYHYRLYFIVRRVAAAIQYKRMQREVMNKVQGEFDYFVVLGYYQMSKNIIRKIKKQIGIGV